MRLDRPSIIGCVVALGVHVGCAGDPGAPGEPGLPGNSGKPGLPGASGPSPTETRPTNAVDVTMTPARALLDRTTTVVFTALDDTVDFTKLPAGLGVFTPAVLLGPDVAVSNVRVLNRRMVSATIRPDKNAATGFRDVMLTAADRPASNPLVAPSSFEIDSPVRVAVTAGVAQQGGRVSLTITNEDTIPFDPAAIAVIAGEASPFIDVSMGAVTAVGPTLVSFTALLDPLSPPGGLPIQLANMNQGSVATAFYSDPASVAIAARAPIEVAAGTPLTNQTVSLPGDTLLYRLSGAPATILDLTVEGTGSEAKPAYWITSRSGKSRELLKFEGAGPKAGSPLTRTLLPIDATQGDLYLVVGDGDGRAGSTVAWTVDAASITGASVTERSTAHGVDSPQSVSVTGAAVISGQISTPTDDDVYRIDLPSAAALRVGITRRNPLGAVTVSTDPTFSTNNTVIAVSSEWNSTGSTAPTTSTTWYVRVQASPDVWLTSYALGVVAQ